MNHLKLVAEATNPTRYTKVIRNPGQDTKYNHQYQVTDYVSRYTKVATAPAEYLTEPLVVADGQGANWVGTNVYEVGQTVEGKTASFTGGLEPVTYRYRFQFKADGTDTWVNDSWTTTTNAKNSVTYELTEAGQVKLQSQARDSQDPVVQLNSMTGIKTVVEPPDALSTEIGNASMHVNDIFVPEAGMTLLINDPVPAEAFFDGDANPTYQWEARNDYPLMVEEQSKQTVITFPQEGVTTVTCTLRDNTATDSPSTVAGTFYIVDAKTFEELKSNGEI